MQRREEYIKLLHHQLGEQHPLVLLVKQCLDDDPSERPTAQELLQQLENVRAQIEAPYQHLNKLEAMRALREKDKALTEQDVELKVKDTALTEKDIALAEKDTALREKDTKMRDLHTQVQVSYPITPHQIMSCIRVYIESCRQCCCALTCALPL